jgi:release factor glutamine methyltransferase
VRVVASDISPRALDVARENAKRLGLEERVRFVLGDCFDGLDSQKFDIIVSNPPYVPSATLSALEVQVRDFEPMGALDGGADGLDVFRTILAGAVDRLTENGALFVELDKRNVTQGAHLAVQLERYSNVAVLKDLNGCDRYLTATGFRD